MVPLLSLQLKARREARGLSQEEAAELFSVDKDTVSRWERGKNRPTGASLIEALKREYSISQKELNDWFSEWATRELGSNNEYFIRDYRYLAKEGIDEEELLKKLIKIDGDLIPLLAQKDEGTVEQWAPIFQQSPFTWKLLTWREQIVGYWQYLFLKDEYFEQVKRGEIRDSEIKPEMLEYPSYVDMSRNYKMYILMIGTYGADEHLVAGHKLVRSFLRNIDSLAANGWFVSEFVAVAFTPDGVTLCNDFGMTFVGRHPSVSTGQLAEIFHATGRQVALQGHLSKQTANAYLKRFSQF